LAFGFLSESHSLFLPRLCVERTQILNKIDIQKHPALSRFCAGNSASLGAAANFLGVHAQKRCSFDEAERLHFHEHHLLTRIGAIELISASTWERTLKG
jgi:hypothetical protein